MDQIDLGCDLELITLLEAEIDSAMRRLLALDSNAVLRLEKMLQKLRIERCVETAISRHHH